MAGDRGLAFVVIGLMGISLTWIVQARMPRANASTGVVAVSGIAPESTPSETVLSEPLPRGIYFNGGIKRINQARMYVPDAAKRHKLSWSRLAQDDFAARKLATEVQKEEIETDRILNFKPIE